MTDDGRPLSPDDLAPRLMEVFALVGPLYRQVLRKVEEAAPIEGASVGVRAVLDLLREHGPMTVPQMGRTQALSRQFVQRMVHDAADRSWVETLPNPAHQRSSLIRLTDEGRAVIDAVTAREHALLRRVDGDLTDAEVTACVRVLGRMLDVFEGCPAPTAPADGPAPSGPEGITPSAPEGIAPSPPRGTAPSPPRGTAPSPPRGNRSPSPERPA